MDIIGAALKFVAQMSYSNFMDLLLASNVSILIWIAFGLAGIFLLFVVIFLYRITENWAEKRQWFVPF